MEASTRNRLWPARQLAREVLLPPLVLSLSMLWLLFSVAMTHGEHVKADNPLARSTPPDDFLSQLSIDLEGTPTAADVRRARLLLSERKRLLAAHPYFALYKLAKRQFGVSWFLVAAVHYQETGFGRAPRTLDVVTAIGAALRAGGARDLGSSAERALVARYGSGSDGRLAAAMVIERARAWRLIGTLPLPGRGELATPVKGVVGGCGYFGCPRPGHLHNGVDFLAPAAAPILAVAEGRVALVESIGESGGYGNFVCIQHRPHLASCYAHMSAFAADIKVGEPVRRGQVVGIVGSTGSSTAPHLHFEVRRGPAGCSRCAVDPLPLLSGEVPTAALPQLADSAPGTPRGVRITSAAPAPALMLVPVPRGETRGGGKRDDGKRGGGKRDEPRGETPPVPAPALPPVVAPTPANESDGSDAAHGTPVPGPPPTEEPPEEASGAADLLAPVTAEPRRHR